MDDGMKAALLVGVPLAIGAGVLIATAVTGAPAAQPPGPYPPIPPVQYEYGTLFGPAGQQIQVPIDAGLINRGTTEQMFVRECYVMADGDMNVLLDVHMPEGNRYVWAGKRSLQGIHTWLDTLEAAGRLTPLQVSNAKMQIDIFLQQVA